MANVELRCMAECRDGAWTAICLDFDIAVQGASFTEVKGTLETAIRLFLERVSELPQSEARDLLRRSAPWSQRAKFSFYSLVWKLTRREDGQHRQFMLTSAVAA